MTDCTMPTCGHPATTRNRADQDVCGEHVAVVVGRDAPDGKHDDAGDDY